jgi:phosphoribosylanthranilate isomerase
MADVKVKVCGLTRLSDVALLTELGADYFGCILYPKSPRYLEVVVAPILCRPHHRAQGGCGCESIQ